jgi:hypothetical protein
MSEAVVHKKKQFRSPSYPAIDLAAAIEKAKIIYGHDRRSAVPVAVVARHWGTNIRSSTGIRLVAAVKQFGLVVEQGSGEDRHLCLSDPALDILLAVSPNSPEAREAIRSAALAPKIHRHLWELYGGSLPSDETLKNYLIRKLEFHDTHVRSFIKQFRATIGFAGLGEGDGCPRPETGDASENDSADEPLPLETRNREIGAPVQDPRLSHPIVAGGPQIVFPLSDGNVVEIRLKKRVSPKDFERIRQLLDLSEGSLVEDQAGEVTHALRLPH